MEKVMLPEQHRKSFEAVLQIGVLKSLYADGLLSARQLQEAIRKTRSSEPCRPPEDAGP